MVRHEKLVRNASGATCESGATNPSAISAPPCGGRADGSEPRLPRRRGQSDRFHAYDAYGAVSPSASKTARRAKSVRSAKSTGSLSSKPTLLRPSVRLPFLAAHATGSLQVSEAPVYLVSSTV